MKGRRIEREVTRGWGWRSLCVGNKSFAGFFWVPGCAGLGSKVSWDSQEKEGTI